MLSWPEAPDGGRPAPSPIYEAAREALGGEEEVHDEELFGPAEGLHSTYRMLRDEVLEASWTRRLGALGDAARHGRRRQRGGRPLPRADQARGADPAARARSRRRRRSTRSTSCSAGSRRRSSGPRIEASALDEYVLGEERERDARREQVAARARAVAGAVPARGASGGLGLSASDIDLYRTCPLKYKFARVFAIPQEPTINQRFGILIHNVLERFHAEEMRAQAGGAERRLGEPGSLDRLLDLFEAGWRRSGFGASDDELQYRDRAVAALARYHERHVRADSRAGLARAQLLLRDRPAPAARARRPRRPAARTAATS